MERRKKSKTPKKDTLTYWKKKFWTEFSRFIRKRDDYICFTCGKEGNMAGHFIPRRECKLILYFNERNVHCQCYYCNLNLGGYGAMYYKNMIMRYGQESVDALFELKETKIKKYTIEEYQELINTYKEKTERLCQDPKDQL